MEVIAGIPLLTSPFRGQFAWNFQYLRIIRLYSALSFVSHHPRTSFGGKRYLMVSYAFTTICMLFGAGGFFFVLENRYFNPNGQIRDMVDAMYYVVITITTVGYGDISPKTVLGRIGAILLALCALIYIPIRVAQLVSIMQISSSGRVKRSGNHVLVSASSSDDFEAYANEFFHPDRTWNDSNLALVAPNGEVEGELQKLTNRKMFEHRLEALQGSLSNPAFYDKYYLDSAKAVVLMADKTKGSMGDAMTLVTAMSLKQRYPSLPLYIQVQSKTSKSTALARGIDKVMCLQELRMGILLQNALHPGFAPFLLNLMRSSSNNNVIRCESNKWLEDYGEGEDYEFYSNAPLFEFQGLTYAEAAMYLYQQYGIVLIGIITRVEKIVAKNNKQKKDLDPDATSTTDTSTKDTESLSTIVSMVVSHASSPKERHHHHHHDHQSRAGEGNNTTRNGDSKTKEHVRNSSSMAFDRDRRALKESLDRGERISYELPRSPSPKTAASLDEIPMPTDFNDDDFEMVVEWELELNPGPFFVIDEKHQGLVLAKDEEDVNNISCEDVKLVQKISTKIARWRKEITAKDQNLHHIHHTSSATNLSLPDSRSPLSARKELDPIEEQGEASLEDSGSSVSSSSSSGSSSSSSDDSDVELLPSSPKRPKKKEKDLFVPLSPDMNSSVPIAHMYMAAHPNLNYATKSLKVSLSEETSSGMVLLSRESKIRVPKELKDNYELVETVPLDLEKVTLPTVEGMVRNHILIVGDWLEDMYDLVRGLRSRTLGPLGALFPIVFLGPEEPNPLMWQRCSVFKDIYVVSGSQVDPRDLARAGAVDARSILVLSSNSETSEEVIKDSRSLTTFLILEKMTLAHVTIEVVSADSLSLLLKGHSPLYAKRPPKASDARPDWEEARRAYKEIAKLGPSSNPYFASGNIFVSSFLDSLICLAYHNEQIVSVLSAITSPEMFETVPLQRVLNAYPYLIRKMPKKKVPRNDRADYGGVDSPHTSATKSKHSSNFDDEDLPEFKPITYGRMFFHFLKYASGAILLGVYRYSAQNTRPYIITAPPSKLTLEPQDVCFILTAQRSAKISNYATEEDDRNTANGSIAELPNARHH